MINTSALNLAFRASGLPWKSVLACRRNNTAISEAQRSCNDKAYKLHPLHQGQSSSLDPRGLGPVPFADTLTPSGTPNDFEELDHLMPDSVVL